MGRKLRGDDARPQGGHDEGGEEDPEAVGDDHQKDLLPQGVALAVGCPAAQLGEGVEVEEGFPEGHDGDGEGQGHGVTAVTVVLPTGTHTWSVGVGGERGGERERVRERGGGEREKERKGGERERERERE